MHIKTVFITFSYSYKTKNALFLDQIFEMEILLDLHVFKSFESKNHIFFFFAMVRLYLSVYLLSAYLKTNCSKNCKYDWYSSLIKNINKI